MITQITIENVKGFGSPASVLNIQLVPDKPNIVVAPNGFGKSSLSKAFDCLTPQGIVLNDTDFHADNKDAIPSLSVEYDGVTYVTNQTRNEVYSAFQCFCVNSPLKPDSITKRISGRFNHTKNYLSIEDVVLINHTPIDKTLSYSSSEYKTEFGINGKILPNINTELMDIIRFPFDAMEIFSGIRKWSKVQSIINVLNSLSGTAEAIAASVDDSLFDDIDSIPEYLEIADSISHQLQCKSKLDVFLRFWILKKAYFADKVTFKQAVERNRFICFVNNLNTSIKALDTTWVDVAAVEIDRKLVIRFPKAGSISYGQRDSLYLYASLERIKVEMNRQKPVILIIDELFDYLDTVNMTIIQYFFSEFIKFCKKKVEIYPIILTHLSPEFYHNYTFSKMNVQYLGFVDGVADTPTKRLLKARGDKESNSPIYKEVSKYLLHYHTGKIDDEATFESMGLRKKWGKGHGFWEYLIEECNKYFAGQPFDYYAITTAVRVRVEKLVYDSIPSDTDKQIFLDTNGTKKKFEEMGKRGIDIPDVYSLLGIVYNDAEHLPTSADSDKPIIYRLKNPMIMHIIHVVFNEANPVTLDLLV